MYSIGVCHLKQCDESVRVPINLVDNHDPHDPASIISRDRLCGAMRVVSYLVWFIRLFHLLDFDMNAAAFEDVTVCCSLNTLYFVACRASR